MAEKDPCLIGSKITIRGQISGSQDLIIEGRVEGKVALQNRLVVQESGTVEADLDVADAEVMGEVRGEVVASRSVIFHSSARVVGTVRAPRVVIEEGARLSGSIEMDVELPPDVSLNT